MFVMITSSCAENIETRYQEKDKGIAFDDNEQWYWLKVCHLWLWGEKGEETKHPKQENL